MLSKYPIRVLWTSNIILPEVAEELGLSPSPFGGWLSSMLIRLSQHPGLLIGVAMLAETPSLKWIERDGVSYIAVPKRRYDRFDVRQADCNQVLREFKPHILHLQGAEMRFARRFLATWKGVGLLSMQGVLNGYAPYELGRLPMLSMLNPMHPTVMATALALFTNKLLRFLPRLRHERAAMKMARHIIGRTLWDQAQAAALCPNARYHHCGEILRDAFYRTVWNAAACEKHTIFIGNAAIPRKGAHIALQALAFLLRDYPDAKIYIAGEDPTRLPLKSLKRHIGYPAYLRHIIDQLKLRNNVCFTGSLVADAMAERLARSHVYLMSSLIENSPNTLGEAMLMGVPVVSAYAGGAPSMAMDEREALFYRADDPAMLAHQIRRIFADDALAARLSQAARERAKTNHDPERNLAALVAIYEAIQMEEHE